MAVLAEEQAVEVLVVQEIHPVLLQVKVIMQEQLAARELDQAEVELVQLERMQQAIKEEVMEVQEKIILWD